MSVATGTITLRFFGALRQAIGQREVGLPWAGATVEEVLRRFADESSEEVRSFIFDRQGRRWRSLLLLLNEEPVEDSQATRVADGDILALLLPLAGG